jgi:predicted phosphodiesterase
VRSAAEVVAAACGPARGARLVHVSDLHNRPAAFRLVRDLCRTLEPAAVVNTGDLSGIGGPFEAALLGTLARVRCPVVFAPGNHDSGTTLAAMRRAGAHVLADPQTVTAGGVRFWGYADPTRTVLFDPVAHPRAGGWDAPAPPDPPAEACVIAVHREAMVARPGGARLVLTGHRHSPEARRFGDGFLVRPGAGGGDHPWSGPVRCAVVDVALPEHAPAGIWLVEVGNGGCRVQEISWPLAGAGA